MHKNNISKLVIFNNSSLPFFRSIGYTGGEKEVNGMYDRIDLLETEQHRDTQVRLSDELSFATMYFAYYPYLNA